MSEPNQPGTGLGRLGKSVLQHWTGTSMDSPHESGLRGCHWGWVPRWKTYFQGKAGLGPQGSQGSQGSQGPGYLAAGSFIWRKCAK
jgi:hypothetical protein